MFKKAWPFLVLLIVNIVYYWLVLPLFLHWNSQIFE